MQGHPTTGSEFSLLRTPVADEAGGGPQSPAMAKHRGQTLRLTGQIIDLVEPGRLPQPLLKTPTSQLAVNGGSQHPDKRKAGGHGPTLADEVEHLLPTPVVADQTGTRNSTANRRNPERAHIGNTLTDVFVPAVPPRAGLLPTPTFQDGANNGGPSQFERNTKPLNTQVLVGSEWGQYTDAIKRWRQTTGRDAPTPTRPDGRDGQHRLNPVFVEWMMGLAEGHVTAPEIGLSRNDQLKACGNGVVPQQAVMALRELLGDRL
jgi:DNA (cytosine-5)-methyltransferase 1